MIHWIESHSSVVITVIVFCLCYMVTAAIFGAGVLLTRRAAVEALRAAHARHEGPRPADHLGRAWTPWPAALFVLDQATHLAVATIACPYWEK